MKIAALTVCAAFIASAAFAADPPSDNLIGAKTANGKVVMGWLNKAFNEHKMGEAFDLYVDRQHYMNHASLPSEAPQTFEAQKALEIELLKPNSKFEIVHIVAQGDLVAVQIHATHTDDPTYSSQLAEFIRVRGGKIVDHWDWHVPNRPKNLNYVGVNRWEKSSTGELDDTAKVAVADVGK